MIPIGQNNVMITAHPDDEVLWAGGLPIRFRDRKWTIVCCSIPRTDPIRAWKFFDVCEALGARGRLLPFVETEPTSPLHAPIADISLAEFDCVVTHNAFGEYGHFHHKQVSQVITTRCLLMNKPVVTFGFKKGTGLGAHELRLTGEELNEKWAALMRYDHKLPYNGQLMTKWEALKLRYFGDERIDPAVETYDVN